MSCIKDNLIKELLANNKELSYRIAGLQEKLYLLERSKFKIAEIALIAQDGGSALVLQIVNVGSTPDGLVLRVSK